MTVRLLFDENISPRLVTDLADLYPGSLHVSSGGLGSRSDQEIWEYAAEEGFVIVTKDRDFREFSLDMGSPPKLIWVGMGNCATTQIEAKLRLEAIRIAEFAQAAEVSMLILR